jgi:hypothetical protein
MSFSPRYLSFPSLAVLSLVALVAACSSTTDSTPKTECTSQAYPALACGSIKSCATGAGSACTAVNLELPDGKKFKCATCTDCKAAQDQATAACGGGTPTPEPDAGDTPDAGTEPDAEPPPEQ